MKMKKACSHKYSIPSSDVFSTIRVVVSEVWGTPIDICLDVYGYTVGILYVNSATKKYKLLNFLNYFSSISYDNNTCILVLFGL